VYSHTLHAHVLVSLHVRVAPYKYRMCILTPYIVCVFSHPTSYVYSHTLHRMCILTPYTPVHPTHSCCVVVHRCVWGVSIHVYIHMYIRYMNIHTRIYIRYPHTHMHIRYMNVYSYACVYSHVYSICEYTFENIHSIFSHPTHALSPAPPHPASVYVWQG